MTLQDSAPPKIFKFCVCICLHCNQSSRYPCPRGFLLILLFFYLEICDEARYEPREKKASRQDRWESHFHAGSALDSCQRCHFLLTNYNPRDISYPFNHMTRRAIKNILQLATTVKSWWHESEDPNGFDQRLSFLGSQCFVPIKNINKRSGSRRRICQ